MEESDERAGEPRGLFGEDLPGGRRGGRDALADRRGGAAEEEFDLTPGGISEEQRQYRIFERKKVTFNVPKQEQLQFEFTFGPGEDSPVSSSIPPPHQRTRMVTTGHIKSAGYVANSPAEVASLLAPYLQYV